MIDWIDGVFEWTEDEMCGLDWGRIYENYHKNAYNPTKETKAVYAKQTAAAEKKGVSNCPLCAIGHAANRSRIYKFAEMDADHVTAWARGGATGII